MTINPAKVFLFKGFFPSTERIWFFYVWYALQKFYEVFIRFCGGQAPHRKFQFDRHGFCKSV